jgi:hypothetical protein
MSGKNTKIITLNSDGCADCPLCNETKGNLIKTIPCSHIFCFDCAPTAFSNGNKCPTCNSVVETNFYCNVIKDGKNEWEYSADE